MNETELPGDMATFRTTDLRDTWVGSLRAASEIGVDRTQAWRLARKWAAMQEHHLTPPVRVLIFGTDDRPKFRYHLADLLAYSSERRHRKQRNWERKSRRFQRQFREWLAGRDTPKGAILVPPLPILPAVVPHLPAVEPLEHGGD